MRNFVLIFFRPLFTALFFYVLTFFPDAYARENLNQILEKFSNIHSSVERMRAYSKFFLGRPYGVGGPLGEGPTGVYDQDPIYRFDTFDCTTFVETIMALALAEDAAEFENQIKLIRYDRGQLGYTTRNHITSLDWAPNLVRDGYLVDVTHKIVTSAQIKIATAVIDKPNWYNFKNYEDLRLPLASEELKKQRLLEWRAEGRHYVPVVATIPYIPLELLIKNSNLLRPIPSGSVVNFVRPNWDLTNLIGTHLNVSHQGLLFWKKGVLYLRHASAAGSVLEIAFVDYLAKFLNHPTLKGVNILSLGKQFR